MASSENDDEQQLDPRAKLMQEVANEMDGIEKEFGDEYKIGRVVMVVEIFSPNDTVNLRVRANQLPWVTLGMLKFAQKAMEDQISGPQ